MNRKPAMRRLIKKYSVGKALLFQRGFESMYKKFREPMFFGRSVYG
jgi:hypothetical protein